ncbi:MAG: LytR/AlgR family response regulator transcription factor [Bacteroidia bacterium]
MISCIAIDDEPLALEVLQQFCGRVSYLQLERTFTSVSEAKEFLSNTAIDVLFLDIQMPNINGIDFFKSLENPPILILTTAHAEFAVEGFNIKAVDFLLKPVLFKRFEEAVSKAKELVERREQSRESENKYLFVRSEYSLIKIAFTNILYIETLDDYVKIHQPGKKPVLTISSIKKIMEKLPTGAFVRVHRSYVVPIMRIESVRGKIISLGALEIPIGKNYEKDFFIAYMRDSF